MGFLLGNVALGQRISQVSRRSDRDVVLEDAQVREDYFFTQIIILKNGRPSKCIDYLVDRVGHERSTAEGEVRRSFTGGYGPLYQIAYMIGGLQFYNLKKELVDSGQMDIRDFHDRIMHENYMPVEMVRALLTDQKLSEDFKTRWRFYKE